MGLPLSLGLGYRQAPEASALPPLVAGTADACPYLCLQVSGRERKYGSKHKRAAKPGKAPTGSKEWIMHKKDTMRKRGYTDIPKVRSKGLQSCACWTRAVASPAWMEPDRLATTPTPKGVHPAKGARQGLWNEQEMWQRQSGTWPACAGCAVVGLCARCPVMHKTGALLACVTC